MSGWNTPPSGGGWDQPPPGWGPPPPGYGGYPPVPRTSPRAVWVGVCGIGSLVALFTICIGFVPAIVALCLAPEAKRELREARGALSGDGLLRGDLRLGDDRDHRARPGPAGRGARGGGLVDRRLGDLVTW